MAETAPPAEVVAVHDVLDQLQAEDSLTAELVKLHYFCGIPLEEAGKLLGMSPRNCLSDMDLRPHMATRRAF